MTSAQPAYTGTIVPVSSSITGPLAIERLPTRIAAGPCIRAAPRREGVAAGFAATRLDVDMEPGTAIAPVARRGAVISQPPADAGGAIAVATLPTPRTA